MDISSIIGVVSGIGFVIGTILLSGSIVAFINIPSVVIVVGGTVAATMIGYPLKEFMGVFKAAMKVFFSSLSLLKI